MSIQMYIYRRKGTQHAGRRFIRIQHCGPNHLAGAGFAERRAGKPVHRRGAAALRELRLSQNAARSQQYGAGGFIQDDVLLIVTAVAQVDTSPASVDYRRHCSAQSAPHRFAGSSQLWERANGSSDDFVEMVDLSQHGGLPSRAQGLTLNIWEWRGDGIYFLGATQDTQIRLRYSKRIRISPTRRHRFWCATAGSHCLRHRRTRRMGAWQPARGKMGYGSQRRARRSHCGRGSPRAAIRTPPPAFFGTRGYTPFFNYRDLQSVPVARGGVCAAPRV